MLFLRSPRGDDSAEHGAPLFEVPLRENYSKKCVSFPVCIQQLGRKPADET